MFRRSLAVAFAALAFATVAQAQVIPVTPSNMQGWGSNPFGGVTGGGTQAITTAQPRSGDGSLAMSIANNGGDRTGFALFPNGGFGTLSQLTSLSYDWMTSAIQSPTFRMYLQVNNPNTVVGGTVIAQMGWYADGSINGAINPNTWVTSDLLGATNNNFFLRMFSASPLPSGQVATSCVNSDRGGDFNARMQSIGAWLSTCNGSGGTINLAGAQVIGIATDMGAWPGDGQTTINGYVDNMSLQFSGQNQAKTYNFETATSTVPEPSTYLLMASGLAALAAVARRRRSATSSS